MITHEPFDYQYLVVMIQEAAKVKRDRRRAPAQAEEKALLDKLQKRGG
jgi:hypothetical protein